MSTKIDSLKDSANSCQRELDDLKRNINAASIEKAQSLTTKLENTKKDIESELISLQNQTDSLSMQEKEKAEHLLNEVEVTLNSAKQLQKDIVSKTVGSTVVSSVKTNPTIRDNVKGSLLKAVNWGSEHRKGLTLSAAAIFGGTWLYKKITKKSEDDEDENDSDEEDEEELEEEKTSKKKKKKRKKSKKKGFRKTTFGKILKWTGIVGGGTIGGYYLGKRFGLWGGLDRQSDRAKYESYQDAKKDPEMKEKIQSYEGIGENVNVLAEKLYNKEYAAGYEDPIVMEKISKEQSGGANQDKGIIPFCLDQKFGSVGEVMAQNSSLRAALANGVDSMISFIKCQGQEFCGMFAKTFLSILPSGKLIDRSTGKVEDKIDEWRAKNENHKEELEYFFRQSIRVEGYLQEKEAQLIDKIINKEASSTGKSVNEIREDDDLYERCVTKNPDYQQFKSGSIGNCRSLLERYGIFDANCREETAETVKDLDEERVKMIGEPDVLKIIYEKKQRGEDLTKEEKEQLSNASVNINKDIDENIISAVEFSYMDKYEKLFNTDEASMEKYLEESGLIGIFEKVKFRISELKTKIDSGFATKEEMYELSHLVNSMLALKKEAYLGRDVIQQDVDENGNIFMRIPGFLYDSLMDLYRGLTSGNLSEAVGAYLSSGFGAGIAIYIVGGGVSILNPTAGKWVRHTGEYIAFGPVKLTVAGIKKIQNYRKARKVITQNRIEALYKTNLNITKDLKSAIEHYSGIGKNAEVKKLKKVEKELASVYVNNKNDLDNISEFFQAMKKNPSADFLDTLTSAKKVYQLSLLEDVDGKKIFNSVDDVIKNLTDLDSLYKKLGSNEDAVFKQLKEIIPDLTDKAHCVSKFSSYFKDIPDCLKAVKKTRGFIGNAADFVKPINKIVKFLGKIL